MNNSSLHFIRDNQRLLFQSRFISTELSELDYASIARAFGCAGIRVEHGGELGDALSEAFASPLPAVVDVRVAGDAVPERASLQKLG